MSYQVNLYFLDQNTNFVIYLFFSSDVMFSELWILSTNVISVIIMGKSMYLWSYNINNEFAEPDFLLQVPMDVNS